MQARSILGASRCSCGATLIPGGHVNGNGLFRDRDTQSETPLLEKERTFGSLEGSSAVGAHSLDESTKPSAQRPAEFPAANNGGCCSAKSPTAGAADARALAGERAHLPLAAAGQGCCGPSVLVEEGDCPKSGPQVGPPCADSVGREYQGICCDTKAALAVEAAAAPAPDTLPHCCT